MNNKKQIEYELCEYILQRYGVELYEEPEVKELAKKIIDRSPNLSQH